MLVEKPLIGQTVIAPYMKDAKYDILFTYNEIYRYEILQRRISILFFLNNFVINGSVVATASS